MYQINLYLFPYDYKNQPYLLKPFAFTTLKKDMLLKGSRNIDGTRCGGGSDVCRFLAAYGTATKAEQMMNDA